MGLWPSREQWRSWNLPSKLTAIGTLVGVVGLGFYTLEKACNVSGYLLSNFESEPQTTIPSIVVRISNSGRTEVSVYPRGEFILWLPQGAAPRSPTIAGRYELSPRNAQLHQGLLTVAPGQVVEVAVSIMNKDYFSRILKKGDTELNLVFRRSDGKVFFSDQVPFTEDSLNRHYLQADANER